MRIHNTGDPYKLPTLLVHAIFPPPFHPLPIVSSSFPWRRIAPRVPVGATWQPLPSSPFISLSLALLLTLFLSKKVHIPLSISLYPFAPSPWFLPYGQMLPYNDLFLHLIPDLSSTFSLLFLRPAFSRLSRNTTRRVPPRERETIPRGASRVALGTLVPEEVRIGLEDRGRDRGKDGG